MIPYNVGNIALSEESWSKVNAFCKQFCLDKSSSRMNWQHLIFACHAAFPMVLSPRLANLIWLNFNMYEDNIGIHKVDAIAVSDILLSSLVRPVARKQFEFIPEIRTYLLFLLNDGQWFRQLGIHSYSDNRLASIATFLLKYLSDQTIQIENNASGFKELNEWAALAYLNPDRLAVKLTEVYAEAFRKQGDALAEAEQLRINMLIGRFSQQIDLKIYDGSRKVPNDFLNLAKFSDANKARLFRRAEDNVSDLYYKLGKEYIEAESNDPDLLQLPIGDKIGQRLDRKKRGVQRIIVMMILDEDNSPSSVILRRKIRQLVDPLKRDRSIQLKEPTIIGWNRGPDDDLLHQIREQYERTLPEDIVLLCYWGGARSDEDANYEDDRSHPRDQHRINKEEYFRIGIKKITENSKCRTVMLIGGTALPGRPWVSDRDIQLSSYNDQKDGQRSNSSVPRIIEIILDLVRYNNGNLTYRDLLLLCRYALYRNSPETSERPIFLLPESNWSKFFLTNTRDRTSAGSYLIIFDSTTERWAVLTDDFITPPVNTTTYIVTNNGEDTPNLLTGEIFLQENRLLYGGMTDRLNKDQAYRVIPTKRSLTYNLVTEDEEIRDLIRSAAEPVISDAYAIWDKYDEVADDTYGYYLKDNFSQITVDGSRNGNEITYQFNYKYNIGKNRPQIEFNWTPGSQKSLIECFSKLPRFHYLLSLTLNQENYLWLKPLDLNIVYYWKRGEENADRNPIDIISVGRDAFRIEKGRVHINPLIIEIKTLKGHTLFIQVYLGLPDMGIALLPFKSLQNQNDREMIVFQVNVEILMEHIHEENPFFLKVLVSRDPITVNFSQQGINQKDHADE